MSLKLSFLGAGAILGESVGPLDAAKQKKIWALAALASAWDVVDEVVPGMNNLMVVLKQGVREPAKVQEQLGREWNRVESSDLQGRVHDIPVVYGGEGGPDLEEVARLAGLSAREVVTLYGEPEYVVYALGAHAGFGYLGGLDRRLATPRLDKPRLSVPAGSVAIGGVQAGVIALTGPSGWRLIGKTDQRFFDPQANPPALLSPGDIVRFRCERVLEC